MGKKESGGFTAEERAAMKERAREQRAEARAARNREEGERAVLQNISALGEPDRTMAQRLHEVVKRSAPDLWPKTWYGMPAYARDGKVICHFQAASKFGTRYATFSFSDGANLDEGAVWPVSFALKELGAAEGGRIGALGRRAVG